MSSPELGIICRSCGEEVSPYVTECPYCGTRLRKRAPKLELRGDELTRRSRGATRRRMARAQRTERLGERPYAVIAAILIPAVLVRPRGEPGAQRLRPRCRSSGPGQDDWWRYFAAPFVYPDIGYLFVASIGDRDLRLAVEQRLGTIPTVVLIVACGALGMLAADGIETAFAEPRHPAGLRRQRHRAGPARRLGCDPGRGGAGATRTRTAR